jgi:heme/copper-type cytochrome/quinol oxidase subunit 2
MSYFLIILIIITLVLHLHFYRWSVFAGKGEKPEAYRSKMGIFIVIISKIILFVALFLSYNLYYVLLAMAVFFIIKLAMAYLLIPHETKDWARSLKISENEAKETVSRVIMERYRKSSKLI